MDGRQDYLQRQASMNAIFLVSQVNVIVGGLEDFGV